jgi:hypothetical protein
MSSTAGRAVVKAMVRASVKWVPTRASSGSSVGASAISIVHR